MLLNFLSMETGSAALVVLLFFVLVYYMNKLPKKKLSFAKRVLIGSGCGTVFGLAVYYVNEMTGGLLGDGGQEWLNLVSGGYICLFRVLIAPIIVIGTIHLVLHTPAYKEVPKLIKVKKWVNTLMMVLATAVSLTVGILMRVGCEWNGSGWETVAFTEGDGAPYMISALVPSNLAVDSLIGNIVGIFVVSMLVGIAARRMSGKYMDQVKPFFDLFDAGFSILGSVCKTVIAWKPSGAAAIMAALMAANGLDGAFRVIWVILAIIVAALVMLVLQVILTAFHGIGPAKFLKAAKIPMVKAVKTTSGSACLPEAQSALVNDLSRDSEIANEVSAYAIASGMQGCGALFPTMAMVFAVNMAGAAWTPSLILAVLIVIVVTSYGITGIPGTATMAEFSVIMGTGMGGVINGVGPMIAIDPIGDVFRTVINVTGCMTNAIIAERWVKK